MLRWAVVYLFKFFPVMISEIENEVCLTFNNCCDVQIQCKGRDSVPDNEAVNCFVYEVIFWYDTSILFLALWFVEVCQL